MTPVETRLQRQYEMLVRQALDILDPIVHRKPHPEDPVRQHQFTVDEQVPLILMFDKALHEVREAAAICPEPFDVAVPKEVVDILVSASQVLMWWPADRPTWPLAVVLHAALSALPSELFVPRAEVASS